LPLGGCPRPDSVPLCATSWYQTQMTAQKSSRIESNWIGHSVTPNVGKLAF
jgi:hypothetical protein